MTKESGKHYGTCTEFVSDLDLELQSCAQWHAQPRGAAMTMETIVTTGARPLEPAVNTVITTSSGKQQVPPLSPPALRHRPQASRKPRSSAARSSSTHLGRRAGRAGFGLLLVSGVVAAVALAPRWLQPQSAEVRVAESAARPAQYSDPPTGAAETGASQTGRRARPVPRLRQR